MMSPTGLPLAFTVALAFMTEQMAKENLLVHVLRSYDHGKFICTDKTGTLTQNKMTAVAGSISIRAKFVRKLDENPTWTGNDNTNRPNAKDFRSYCCSLQPRLQSGCGGALFRI
jgi:P-type Ca2+ transporter type 2C